MDNITKSIAKAYVNMYESKKVERASWVPESIADEDVSDFMGAAAAAHKAGNSHFTFGGKKYKVTMKKDTAKKINDAVQVCEMCGKVHEGSCKASDKEVKEASQFDIQNPNSDDQDVLEPKAKGEQDFVAKHEVAYFDGEAVAADTIETIKKSGPVKA